MRKEKALTWIAVFLGVLVLLLMNHTEGFAALPVPKQHWPPLNSDGTTMTQQQFFNCLHNPTSAGCQQSKKV